MDEESFEDLKEQVEANTKMIEGILSGLLDGSVRFKLSESCDTYEGEPTRSISGNYHFKSQKGDRDGEELTTGNVEAKICLNTGGKYNFKTGQCIHEKVKS